jgi:lipocalin
MVTSVDGSIVFVTGSSLGGTNDLDYATAAYDAATGTPMWVRRYNGPANDYDHANSIAASPDGSRVFVTGHSGDLTTGDDYTTVAYATATGTPLWLSRYNGPANSSDDATSLTTSPDGSKVFVTGYSDQGLANYDYATVAYDAATGVLLWVSRYDGPGGDDKATAIAASPDGSKVFVTGSIDDGTSRGGLNPEDYATVAYDSATGAALWARRYNGPDDASDLANAVGASPDGSKVFVTGLSDGGASNYDYATAAYDAGTGAVIWVRRNSGPGDSTDVANALTTDATGTLVLVSGSTEMPTSGDDYATVTYDAATGAVLGLRRYNGTANDDDMAIAVAASPDGSRVFVTGYSWGGAIDWDYATVAYKA